MRDTPGNDTSGCCRSKKTYESAASFAAEETNLVPDDFAHGGIRFFPQDTRPDRQMVGAGTVLSPEDAAAVCRAGGKFIISPNTDPDVIRESKRLDMISIPGFFTASEGFTAIKAGADYLKLFPACLGPSCVKDLKAVIRAPIMAVGGVNADNIPDFMKVCCGMGIGSALYKADKSPEDLRKDAFAMAAAVRKT